MRNFWPTFIELAQLWLALLHPGGGGQLARPTPRLVTIITITISITLSVMEQEESDLHYLVTLLGEDDKNPTEIRAVFERLFQNLPKLPDPFAKKVSG